jgi:hypothetical protein
MMMKEAKFDDLTLLDQKFALGLLAKDGEHAMSLHIAKSITLNADLLY